MTYDSHTDESQFRAAYRMAQAACILRCFREHQGRASHDAEELLAWTKANEHLVPLNELGKVVPATVDLDLVAPLAA
jgi:hypothetical protein